MRALVQYYWRQSAPYVPRGRQATARLLLQNTRKQAEVVRRIVAGRTEALEVVPLGLADGGRTAR